MSPCPVYRNTQSPSPIGAMPWRFTIASMSLSVMMPGSPAFGRDRQLLAAQRYRVEQHAAAHEAELADVLDAERAHAVGADVLVVQEAAVVEEHALRRS